MVTTVNGYPLNLPAHVLQSAAVQRAIAYGVDMTLLISNLRLTPTERLEKAQRVLTEIAMLRRSLKKSSISSSQT